MTNSTQPAGSTQTKLEITLKKYEARLDKSFDLETYYKNASAQPELYLSALTQLHWYGLTYFSHISKEVRFDKEIASGMAGLFSALHPLATEEDMATTPPDDIQIQNLEHERSSILASTSLLAEERLESRVEGEAMIELTQPLPQSKKKIKTVPSTDALGNLAFAIAERRKNLPLSYAVADIPKLLHKRKNDYEKGRYGVTLRGRGDLYLQTMIGDDPENEKLLIDPTSSVENAYEQADDRFAMSRVRDVMETLSPPLRNALEDDLKGKKLNCAKRKAKGRAIVQIQKSILPESKGHMSQNI